MEIHKIFIKRIGFTLIRVHRQQNVITSTSDNEILLQNLKWPIESMFIGLRPQSQKTHLADWHKFTSISRPTGNNRPLVPGVVGSGSTWALSGTTATVTATGSAYPVTGSATLTNVPARLETEVSTKTIDRLTISAHGISLYNDMPADFFHQYTTYTFGGAHIQTPEDEGCLMVPFNLYTGTYQPSGHVNVSRAREFYIRFVSSVIGQIVSGSAVPGELVIKNATVTNKQMPYKLDSALVWVNIVSESHRYNCLVEC